MAVFMVDSKFAMSGRVTFNVSTCSFWSVSALVMVKGMRDGTFTGKKFSDYFNSAPPDWVNARRMVNGTDRAADIAKFAVQYYDALRAAA